MNISDKVDYDTLTIELIKNNGVLSDDTFSVTFICADTGATYSGIVARDY